ncbi:MAG: TonB C-terminal domain-containing protein, partial [Bdellovibrionota bacterium]
YRFEKRAKTETEAKVRESKLTPDPTALRGGQDGGDQAIMDRTLPEGSENLLKAQESVFYSFYSRLYEAIAPIWQSRIREVPRSRKIQAGEYNTVVEVVFDRQGNLIAIRHLEDSGIPEFDTAVDTAWKSVGRFPNPPKGLTNAQGRVHTGWTFSVHVGDGFQVQFLPPERNY